MKLSLLPSIIILIIGLTGCSTQSDISKDKTVSTGDNTMTSVDWDGTYIGILPCADCEGIETMIKLNKDLTYELKTKYLGKDETAFESKGTFTWNDQGNTITLSGLETAPRYYFVGENMIRQLDMHGKQITGALADKYVLKEISQAMTNKYWKLVELMGKKVQHEETNKREPHMILRSEEQKVHGSGGCNTFNGIYELKGNNRIAFSKLTTTLMACPNMETEQEFFKVLEMADNYFLDADTLILNKARMAPLARFVAVYLK
ncbi:MAG: copper resistance protein NlpE N-terminal domain-containing protein [Ignavibacteriaceae bacterium]|nr:copper resistance protein NlpE N-terminal domain-containing protein [Ignavibacteriaceae bacterium]